MRKYSVIFIIIAVLYFILGYILVIFGVIKQELYNQIATIVGGIASILGLLSFVLPTLKVSDFKNIEIDTLKSLAQTAEEIQKKEVELSTKQNDLTKLELQKKELEFLVRKASLNLFFKEQIERYYETLEKQISDNKEISRTINEIKELEFKISELEIEIEKSPNTENILKIIEEARNHKKTIIEIKTPFDSLLEPLIRILRLR